MTDKDQETGLSSNATEVRAQKLAQLRESVKALKIDLEAEEIEALEEPYRPHAVRGHDPYPLD